jgi:tetratricopeptide (TPR) repeat protein/DNA-binding CsgD family transcriptional regulator
MMKDHLADVSAEHLPTAQRIIELHEQFASEFDPLNLQKFREWADEELRLAQQINWSYGLIHAHADVAQVERTSGDLPGSIAHLTSAEAHARTIGDTLLTATMLIRLGSEQLHTSDFKESLRCASEAIEVISEEEHPDYYAQCQCLLSYAYLGLTQYDRAVGPATRAREIARAHGIWTQESKALLALGMICDLTSDHKQAVRFYEAALDISLNHGDQNTAGTIYVNMSNSLVHDGQTPRAVECAERAIELARQSGDPRSEAVATRTLGTSLLENGEFDQARISFERSLQSYLALGIRESAAGILGWIGQLEQQRGNLAEAAHSFRQMIAMTDTTNMRYLRSLAHGDLYKVLKQLGNAVAALEQLEECKRLEAELFTEESDKRLQEMKVRFELDKAQSHAEIERLRSVQLQYQLDAKQRELAATAMSLARQSELLGRFRNELRQIVRDDSDPATGMKAVREKLKELPSEAIDWSKFEAEFQQAYPEFRARLMEKYPMLTKMEVRICSLVKVRLASMDISQLLNLSERTVETHRLNIRRKMELGKRADLYEVLAEL